MRFTILLTACALTALTGCAPYTYSTEITAFSTGVTSVSGSYDTGRQALETSASTAADQQRIADREKLDITPGCSNVVGSGTSGSTACAIVDKSTRTPISTGAAELADLEKVAPAFTALKTYSTSLAAVTNAADDTTLTTATTGLETSVTSLGQAVAKLDPGAATPFNDLKAAEPILALASKAYLDQRRYDALRRYVPKVDATVATLSGDVRAALADIRQRQLRQLEAQIAADRSQLETADKASMTEEAYKALLTDIETKVAAFNTARAVDPADAATKLAQAHHALAQAIEKASGQSTAVYNEAISFMNAASVFDAAVKASASATGAAKTSTTAAAPKKTT